MNKIKKIFAIVLVVTIVFTSANLFSVINTKTTNNALNCSNEIILISDEEFQELKNQSSSARSSTAQYIAGYDSFIPYAQTEFTQTNSCGPAAAANIFSYFQGYRGVSLFSGDVITQSIYDQICTDVSWSTSGTTMVNLCSGIETFCARAGRTCVIDRYLLNLWSDVTRDVAANKPIIVNDTTQNHFFVVFGYDTIDSNKYLYVCTGLNDSSTPMFGWLLWGQDSITMRSVNIY